MSVQGMQLQRQVRHINMSTERRTNSRDMKGWEIYKLIQDENEDNETMFDQAAFQCFDWNHSDRIATSVRCPFDLVYKR